MLGNAYNMCINKVVFILQRHIIRQMFTLTPMTHCEPYAANTKILFINDLFNYQLCLSTSHVAYASSRTKLSMKRVQVSPFYP